MLVALAIVALATALGAQILVSTGEGWRRISGAASQMESGTQVTRMLDRFANRTEHALDGGMTLEEDGRVVANRRGDRLEIDTGDDVVRLRYREAGPGASFVAPLPGDAAWRFVHTVGPGGARLTLTSADVSSHTFSVRLRIAAPATCRFDPGTLLCREAEISP